MRPRIGESIIRRHRGLVRVCVALVSVAATAPQAAPVTAQWTLGEPDLTLGEATGLAFANIVGVIVTEDRIYIADVGLSEIHAFDTQTGEHEARAGREGEGPGEFRGLAWIGSCDGDNLWALDQALGRASVYSTDLDHLRTFQIEGTRDRLVTDLQCAGGGLLGVSTLPDSELSSTGPLPAIGETYRSSFEVVLYRQDGSLRRSIGPYIGGERYRSPGRLPGRYSDLPLLWGRHPVLGSAEWGFVLGSNEGAYLLRYDSDGNISDTLRLAEPFGSGDQRPPSRLRPAPSPEI